MQTCLFVLDVALIAFGAHRLARHALPGRTSSEVAAYATALGTSIAMTVLLVLAACGLLTPVATTSVFVALALAALRVLHPTTRATDPLGLDRTHLPLLIPLAGFAPHLLRSMVSPPRAWDALTYHLPRAANWIHDAGFAPHIAPDAGRYYEFFPPGGDLVFAFTFLAGRGDALLYLVYGASFSAVILGAYVLARALGARTLDASLAAALIGTMPCVVQFAASAYVDNTLLALFLFATAFAVRAFEGVAPEAFALGSLATAGAAAVTKGTALPLLLATALVCAVLVKRGLIRPRAMVCASLLAALPSVLWIAYVTRQTGSPTYPFGVRLGGLELTHGNALLRTTLDGTSGYGAGSERSYQSFFVELFVGSRMASWPHLNLGLGGALAIPLGVGGLTRARALPRWFLVVLVALALAPLLSVLTPSVVTLRSVWNPVSGRLISPLVAVAACLAASWSTRLARVGLAVAIVAALPALLPVGVEWNELARGARAITVASLFAIAAVAPALISARSSLRVLLVAVVIGLSPLALRSLEAARAPHRYESFDDLASGRTYEFHRVPIGDQVSLWRRLDGPRPERIAFASGFVAPGHTWFRYPLYGSRLQNGVVYVSATRSGAIEDTADRLAHPLAMDADAYADRLVAQGITALVFVAPPSPEAALVIRNRARFRLRFSSPSGEYVVFRPMPRPGS